jgi:hypothetical protein
MAGVQHNQDPLSLGLIGDGSPCYRWLCLLDTVDQKERKAVAKMHFGFSVISFGLFIDLACGRAGLRSLKRFCIPFIS